MLVPCNSFLLNKIRKYAIKPNSGRSLWQGAGFSLSLAMEFEICVASITFLAWEKAKLNMDIKLHRVTKRNGKDLARTSATTSLPVSARNSLAVCFVQPIPHHWWLPQQHKMPNHSPPPEVKRVEWSVWCPAARLVCKIARSSRLPFPVISSQRLRSEGWPLWCQRVNPHPS